MEFSSSGIGRGYACASDNGCNNGNGSGSVCGSGCVSTLVGRCSGSISGNNSCNGDGSGVVEGVELQRCGNGSAVPVRVAVAVEWVLRNRANQWHTCSISAREMSVSAHAEALDPHARRKCLRHRRAENRKLRHCVPADGDRSVGTAGLHTLRSRPLQRLTALRVLCLETGVRASHARIASAELKPKTTGAAGRACNDHYVYQHVRILSYASRALLLLCNGRAAPIDSRAALQNFYANQKAFELAAGGVIVLKSTRYTRGSRDLP